MSFYVTAIDETLKKENDNKTIGLLLCKNKSKLTVGWSLKGSNLPIGVSSCELQNILDKLPTEEDINMHLDFKG